MELNEFISQTIKEIFDGIKNVQSNYKTDNGSVNSDTISCNTDVWKLWGKDTYQPAHLIEFDVAVTTTEGKGTKGGIGVFVGPVGLGSQGKSEISNTSYSRIKFSVPVFLPTT